MYLSRFYFTLTNTTSRNSHQRKWMTMRARAYYSVNPIVWILDHDGRCLESRQRDQYYKAYSKTIETAVID